ncbi:hypothetical protein GIB67_001226 [Kingdonia uniflora]|uniref:C2H2-type domain-containing protein n=1 Tax=Kingdonia uniflora TaxID=39325 RepID=A0A7J7LGP0_9MAGN|nr:hypothetical protein GIB67_001226 [Kingdonia uniflora]
MATFVAQPQQQQQPCFKHFCRICKKGFGCGRALGGHMRAHGIVDNDNELIEDDEENPDSDNWDDDKVEPGSSSPPNNKRMYALRTNPNRLKSCKVCENCGEEFSSWKLFLEHGKRSGRGCGGAGGDVDYLVSSGGSEDEEEGDRRGNGWYKGTRSRRAKMGNSNCPSSEEEDLAHCLVLLSSARVDPLVAEREESCASASKEDEEDQRNPLWNPVGIDIRISHSHASANAKAKGVARGMFECKACKKVFTSHQALGGHRASHKKVKGCFAAKMDELEDSIVEEDVIPHNEFPIIPFSNIPAKKKSKVHECSICHRVFSSGQALGGHKRCHWLISNSQDNTPTTTTMFMYQHYQEQNHQQIHQRRKLNKSEAPALDLNLFPSTPAGGTSGVVFRENPEPQLSLDVATEIYFHPLLSVNDEVGTARRASVDDEADSKEKLAKLSDLKDINLGNGSSSWLQVGAIRQKRLHVRAKHMPKPLYSSCETHVDQVGIGLGLPGPSTLGASSFAVHSYRTPTNGSSLNNCVPFSLWVAAFGFVVYGLGYTFISDHMPRLQQGQPQRYRLH